MYYAASLPRTCRGNGGKFGITTASLRNHRLFTPLLTSISTAALEHKPIIMPICPFATRKGAQSLISHALCIKSARNDGADYHQRRIQTQV